MATQTLEFNAPSGLTISCKLFAVGSDTIVDTQTATEKTNAKNRYTVAFTDAPEDAYQLIGFVGSVGGFVNEIYDLTATTATFYPRSEALMRGTDGANTVVPPSVAQFEARTLVAADYFVVGDYTAPPAAATIATATRSELATELAFIDAAVSTRSTHSAADVLTALGTGTWATALASQSSVDVIDGIIDAILEDTGTTLPAQIAGISGGAGSGARTVTVTVNDGTDPLQNATVRMTEGVNTYTSLTNASGVAVFNLDDATYVVGVSKSGYTFAGSSLVVDGTEVVTYSMTQVAVSPPDDPALCAVTIPIVNQHGVALVGETVEIRFNEFADTATTTTLVLSPPPTQTSDANGYVSVNLLRLASYSVFYGVSPYQRRVDIDVPDAASFIVGE